MTREELEDTVIKYMDSFTTMTLACCHNDTPWAAPVYYARQGFDLIFFSSSDSRHSTNLAANPGASAAIYGEYRRWQEIKGLQMEGIVEPVTGTLAKAKAMAIYLKRYPFVKEFFSDPGALSSQVVSKMTRVSLYVFRPRSIRYLDNQGGFGNRWELRIDGGLAVGEPVRG